MVPEPTAGVVGHSWLTVSHGTIRREAGTSEEDEAPGGREERKRKGGRKWEEEWMGKWATGEGRRDVERHQRPSVVTA
jgi:hypothetical protein